MGPEIGRYIYCSFLPGYQDRCQWPLIIQRDHPYIVVLATGTTDRDIMIDLLHPWIIFAQRLWWSWWHCSWWLVISYITIIMIMIFMVTLERITWLNNRWLVALCSGISVSLLSTTVLPSDRVEALQSLSCYAFSFYHMHYFLSHFRALPLLYSMIFICQICLNIIFNF